MRTGFLTLLLLLAIILVALFFDASDERTTPDSESELGHSGLTQEPPTGSQSVISDRSDALQDHYNDPPPSLLVAADDIGISAVQSWIDDYRASMQGEDQFEEYSVAILSQPVVDGIRDGTRETFIFNYSKDRSIEMFVNSVREKKTDWFFHGSDPNNSNNVAIITFFPNGEARGEVHVQGVGRYMIQPTGTHPYSIIYLADGTYIFD